MDNYIQKKKEEWNRLIENDENAYGEKRNFTSHCYECGLTMEPEEVWSWIENTLTIQRKEEYQRGRNDEREEQYKRELTQKFTVKNEYLNVSVDKLHSQTKEL